MTDSAVVVGVNASAGLGAAVARRFAREGLHVVLAGRTDERLQQVAREIEEQGGKASAFVTDATVEAQVNDLMDYACAQGTLCSVVYNVGNNQIIPFAELGADQFEKFWRVCTLAGFQTAKAALPELEKNSGSLLFTGASASMRGKPNFAHFCSAKAALRSLAQALAKEYGPRGVHVGHVVVDGVINGERAQQGFGEYVEALGEDGTLDPDAIADAFWYMHSQPRSAWTFEVDIRPFKENW